MGRGFSHIIKRMEDIEEIKKSIKVINEELGDTQISVAKIEGQLIWIRYLLMGVLGVTILEYFT